PRPPCAAGAGSPGPVPMASRRSTTGTVACHPPYEHGTLPRSARDIATIRRSMEAAECLPGSPAAVALTFDDGPDPRFTPGVLAALGARGTPATFFVMGEQAARHPELVARLRDAG